MEQEPSMDDFWGMEFDWFATDATGDIGIFCFGGYGFIPKEVLLHHETHSKYANQIPLPHFGSLLVWHDYAEFGFYVYDWNEEKRLYTRLAEPAQPLDVPLKKNILQIERLPSFTYNFQDKPAVSIAELTL
ncbi:hypothetical protein GCM10023185_00030 [Hymenobacter saemangeumensis]|uniref:Uncharacterized protein n=1 Tax=Hymenobacter saemangeumensis TaxID=1084522 RepID=A0ABP8HWC9_9BACT